MEYLFLFLFILFSVGVLSNKIAKIYILPFIVVLMSMWFGFRDGYGTDYYNYIMMVDILKYQPDLDYVGGEPGFRALILLLNQLGMPEYSILAISFIVTIVCIASSIYRFSANAVVSFVVVVSFGFLFASFNVVRQALAFALICSALNLLRDEKYLLFSGFCLLVAYLFHNTVFLLAFIPLFRYVHLSPRLWVVVVILTLPLMKVSGSVFEFIAGFLGGDWFVYGNYFESDWATSSRSNMYLNTAIRVMMTLWIISRMNYFVRDRFHLIVLNTYLIGFCIQIVFIDVQAFNRLALVFTWLSFLVVPMAVMSYQNIRNRLFIIAGLMAYSAGLVWLSVSGHYRLFDMGSHLL